MLVRLGGARGGLRRSGLADALGLLARGRQELLGLVLGVGDPRGRFPLARLRQGCRALGGDDQATLGVLGAGFGVGDHVLGLAAGFGVSRGALGGSLLAHGRHLSIGGGPQGGDLLVGLGAQAVDLAFGLGAQRGHLLLGRRAHVRQLGVQARLHVLDLVGGLRAERGGLVGRQRPDAVGLALGRGDELFRRVLGIRGQRIRLFA